MNIDFNKPSIALFGSVARGDHDAYSDRDLLLVSEDEGTLRRLKTKYAVKGWSCTAYTWKRLNHLAAHGSLFVQHLKQESIILSDPSERLSSVLASYSPNPSYRRESDGAASLLGNLMQHLPRCEAGPMWTLDVLAVGFRSLAVANLAENGIYEFSNSGIMDGLTRIGMARNEDRNDINILRRIKSLYRQGAIDSQIKWSDVFDWIRLVDRIFRLGLSAQCARTIEILELALARIGRGDTEFDWYARCRRIESALWMMKPRKHDDRSEFRRQRREMFRIVKSPNSYAWHFTGGYESMQSDLTNLAGLCAV